MTKLLATAAAITALLAGQAVAAENVDQQKYFTVDPGSIMIQEVPSRDIGRPGDGTIPGTMPKPTSGPVINPPMPPAPHAPSVGPAPSPSAPAPSFDDVIHDVNGTVAALDNIVNLAQKIWNIIQQNQPVVNITTNYANAVPYGYSHWTQLQGWHQPASKRYSFSMKNGFGSEVVKVIYQVDYTYGGNLDGKGKFLTGVTVEPISVTTAWGYKVSLTSMVPDSTIANVGTSADPVAAMQVQLDWTVHTALKDISSKAIYYVQGDGLIQEMGTPFKNAKEAQSRAQLDAVTTAISTASFN